MKTVFNKILHCVRFGVITLVLILALSVLALRLVSPHLENYNDAFEKFIGDFIKQPVKIRGISIGNRGLEPVFRFDGVAVLSEDGSHEILQAREMEVGIDLIGSLFKWRFKPGLLVVRGAEVSVDQKKDGEIKVLGIPVNSMATTKAQSAPDGDGVLSWLFEQGRVFLEEITLIINLADGKKLNFSDLYFKLYNDTLHHELKLVGAFQQEKSQAFFKIDLKTRGSFFVNGIPAFFGDVILDNWQFDLNSAAGDVFFLPTNGEINLLVRNSNIVSKIFRQPIAIKTASSKLAWKRDEQELKVNLSKINFKDEWLKLTGSGELLFQNSSKMPIVDIKLGIGLDDISKAKLYYPAAVMPSRIIPWLDSAFVSSKLIDGTIILQGPLDKFPFDNNEGKFLADTNIRDVLLNYDPEWLPIEGITGKMVFANRSMTIIADSAKILKAPTQKVTAIISDLDRPILDILGSIKADAKVGMDFVNASPLKQTLGRKLEHVNLSGPMKFSLKMRMPLSDELPEKETDVEGGIDFYNSQAISNDFDFSIDDLNGNLHFKNDDLVTKKLTGKMFDRPVDIYVRNLESNAKDSVTQVDISGNIAMTDFDRIFSSNLASNIFGEFEYQALLELHSAPDSQNAFKLKSDLQGITVDLPEPFNKQKSSATKFNLESYFGGNKTSQIVFDYNDQVSAVFNIKKTADKSFELFAGDIRLGGKPAKIVVDSGLVVSGNMDKLDWSAWKKYFSKTKDKFAKIFPDIKWVDLKIANLKALDQVFENVAFKADPKNKGWDINLLMTNVVGKLFLPNDKQAVIRGNFKKIYFDSKKEKIAKLNPKDLPALNFKIDTLKYGDKSFKNVEFVTERHDLGIKINKLALSDNELSIKTKGEWLAKGDSQSSYFRGSVTSRDVGSLLKKYDITKNMVGGNGEVYFVLRWPDSPYNPSLKTISGTFGVEIKDGRIINLGRNTENKLGFGRVLNVLSLQSLPKRLSLDFSDLTQQGFAFDSLEGDCELSNGKAMVRKLDIDGQTAFVKAYGLIGMVSKNYDLMLSAVPKLTSSLPVAAAILGGPVVGVLSFLADKIVSKAIEKSASYTYHVTGSWANPQIDKL